MKVAPRFLQLCLVLLSMVAYSSAQGNPVPASFFAVDPWNPNDFPTVDFGTVAHPQFAWPEVARCRGCITDQNFARLDAFVQTALTRHMYDPATNTVNVSLTLGLTPDWALTIANYNTNPCKGTGYGFLQCPYPPENIQDWRDFVTALVNHYNGQTRNGVNYPHIRYYELWNEANDSGWWHGDIPTLVNLAAVAYPIIHQDPYSQLLTPSVAGPVGQSLPNSASTWMNNYLAGGGAQYADAGAYHGYLAKNTSGTVIQPFPMPEQDSTSGCTAFVDCFGSVVSKATQMRAVFDLYLPGKPMLQTEGGWGNLDVPAPAPPAPPIDIWNSDLQVAWLSRYYLLHAGLRSTMNLQMSAWFAWDGPDGWGVIEDSPGSGNPTAAGKAYSQIYAWLVGAEMDQPCSASGDGIWTCSMTRGAGYSALAIWDTQGTSQYTPAPGFTRYHCLSDASCLNGNPVSIAPGSQLTIGAKPILLESPGQICPLYDATKAVHSGATIPIKLQLCDATGKDLSSANVTLQAGGIVQVNTDTATDVIDPGSSNPDNDFRFDPTLGSSGGYVLNLKTTGLSTGSYVLNFSTVTGDKMTDSFVFSTPFRVK